MASSSSEISPNLIWSSKFEQIFKNLGKNGIQKLNHNAPLLKETTDRICKIAGQAPLVGICVQALCIIIDNVANYIEIDEKAKKVKDDAKFLKTSIEKIRDAGGDDEFLRESCVALLCSGAFAILNPNSGKQSWAKCVCGFICAKCDTKELDDIATTLRDVSDKLSLLSGIINAQFVKAIADQIPKPSRAPLADSSLKINNKDELLKFITQPGIRVLSVCGMGGIGKTTLLTALYQEFPKRDKQVKAFVKVGKKPTSITQLQTKILQALENKNETFQTTEQGRIRLQHCLQRLKEWGTSLCLSIDNVWTVHDLKELLPEDLDVHLPESSCLIISTRSREVATEFRDICCPTNANAYQLFFPKLLDTLEAEQLFMQCARIQDKFKEWNLINEIVPLCNGLPLAIKTYGTHFRRPERRKEVEWRKVKGRILEAVESPSNAADDSGVFKQLKISIDHQTENVQDAFIDGALFWRGQQLEIARCALYIRNEDPLEVLLEESIFSSMEDGEGICFLECHDLFFAIAEKCAKERNWKYLRTIEMRASQEGTEEIRGIHIEENLQFQALQKNSLVKYIRCNGVRLTCDTWNTSQTGMHNLKALELSEKFDISLLQFFPNLQVLSSGSLKYGINSIQVGEMAGLVSI